MLNAKNQVCTNCTVNHISTIRLCTKCNREKQIAKLKISKEKKLKDLHESIDLEVFKIESDKVKSKTTKKIIDQKELDKIRKEKLAKKAERDRLRRKAKRDLITEKKLDTLVSKVIRTLYGNHCCTCGKEFTYATLHNGHFQSRRFRVTRFNPENCSSQCPSDNLYLQGLQYEYGLYLNNFHGEDTAEKLINLAKSDIKIGKVEREAIYKVYQEALEHLNLKKLITDYYKIFEKN